MGVRGLKATQPWWHYKAVWWGGNHFPCCPVKKLQTRAGPLVALSFMSGIIYPLLVFQGWMCLQKWCSSLGWHTSGSQSYLHLLAIRAVGMTACHWKLSLVVRVFLSPQSRQRAWSWEIQKVPTDFSGTWRQGVFAALQQWALLAGLGVPCPGRVMSVQGTGPALLAVPSTSRAVEGS